MGTLLLLEQDFLLELRFCFPNIQCLLFSVNSQEQEEQECLIRTKVSLTFFSCVG